MNKLKKISVRLALLGTVLLGISTVTVSCRAPGLPGRTFLAIAWSSAPQSLYFPAFPPVIISGDYVDHSAGSYVGEYIAWDGSYWRADYWIDIEDGGAAPLFGHGDDGDYYYLSMWLFSFGPSMYTDDIIVRSVEVPGSVSENGSFQQPAHYSSVEQTATHDGQAPVAIIDARTRASGLNPVVRESEWTNGRVRVHVRFTGYDTRRRDHEQQ